jgi:hypothetical protein
MVKKNIIDIDKLANAGMVSFLQSSFEEETLFKDILIEFESGEVIFLSNEGKLYYMGTFNSLEECLNSTTEEEWEYPKAYNYLTCAAKQTSSLVRNVYLRDH